MNTTSFPNKPKCSCEGHQEKLVLFLKAWGIVLGVLSTIAGVGYGSFRLVAFLCEKFGTWQTLVVLGIVGVSAGIGFILANDTLSEQERQKRDCKTHNV